jgi:hypothetical protein
MMHAVPPLLAIIGMVFWIWMIVDCVRNPLLRGGAKLGWLLLIIFTNWVGALIYFFIGRMRSQATFMPPHSQWYGRPNQPPTYYQPSQPPTYYQPSQPPAEEAYREYQQGYGVVPVERPSQVSDTSNWQHYEEPQPSYPQLPQQELPLQQQELPPQQQ